MQESIFDIMYPKYKSVKPIRLIEMFGGTGAQFNSLKNLGANFKHYKLIEWAVKSIQCYNDMNIQDYTDYSSIDNMDKESLINYLYEKGISMDYNEPMTLEQIKRKPLSWLNQVYNNIKATSNLVNIQLVKGEDLEIVDTDKYDYAVTYSFPCQDLSVAGFQKGMSRDSGTRSGMLWEVERILDECNIDGELPQILLMENVPQVIGTENVEFFNEWQHKLESLGYKNYHDSLIATDYSMPQSRNRTFMLSILGEYSYKFPDIMPLRLTLNDFLEKNVDEKYYLNDKQTIYILDMGNVAKKSGRNIDDKVINPNIARTISCRGAVDQRADVTNFVIENETKEIKVKDYKSYISYPSKSGLYNSGLCRARKHDMYAPTISTLPDREKVWLKNKRIRKLTPRECFRLMGFTDENFDNASKNLSDNALYHIAGDSIVVTVLMAIFGELLGIDWKSKINDLLKPYVKEE